MKLPDKYAYGQLFAFSGMDGVNAREDDFVGMFVDEPVRLRFEFPSWVMLSIPMKGLRVKALTGDFLDAEYEGKRVLVAFSDARTVVGVAPVKPAVDTELECIRKRSGEREEIVTEFGGKFRLLTRESAEGVSFTFRYLRDETEETELLGLDALETLVKARYAYFDRVAFRGEEKYEKLYAKCLCINKLNVYSPSGKLTTRWTTPDRIPHRYMWLWDSVFHSFAFAAYDTKMAKEALLAPLEFQAENGFIAHMMDENGAISSITQPPVFAWGAWNLYEKTGDKEFLATCAPKIEKFLLWCMESRDKNGNGLLEWTSDPLREDCRCDESGMDNSPRFDFNEEPDAVDFSSYLANDVTYLAKAYEALGEREKAARYAALADGLKEKINALLWDEKDGMYYDRLPSGKLTRVQSSVAFLPLFAGVCDERRAARLVENLTDGNKFWTEMPIPSIAKDSPFYDCDMWRGCSWLNINYFIIFGLKKYGYTELAEELRARTLAYVLKWFDETGNIFEFYDADGKLVPFCLKRKGAPAIPPDYRKHIHSITDYNWSACFTELLVDL